MAVSESKSFLVTPETEVSSCWSCKTMRASHFCSACGKVQPPVPSDYFAYLGFPRKLNLDTAALEKEFYALSRRLHPDLFARAAEQEREWSLEQSSMLNDAYRTLKDPIRRTQYLLRLEGVELEEQSKAATEQARATSQTKKQVVPASLLEEVFELNLQLEEMRTSKQMGERDPQLVTDLEAHALKLQKDLDALTDELKSYWDEWDKLIDRELGGINILEADRKRVRDKMVDLLNRRNYYRNLVRDVNEALEA